MHVSQLGVVGDAGVVRGFEVVKAHGPGQFSSLAIMKPSATVPRTNITPRSTGGERRRPTLEPDQAADQRTDGDQADRGPADPVEREEQVRRGGDNVDPQHQDVLHGVGVLHGSGHKDTEDADQEDALRRYEVTAVDAGEVDQHHEEDPVLLVPEGVLRVFFPGLHPALEPGWNTTISRATTIRAGAAY